MHVSNCFYLFPETVRVAATEDSEYESPSVSTRRKQSKSEFKMVYTVYVCNCFYLFPETVRVAATEDSEYESPSVSTRRKQSKSEFKMV